MCCFTKKGRFVWLLTVSVVLKVLWAVFLLLLAGLVFAKRYSSTTNVFN